MSVDETTLAISAQLAPLGAATPTFRLEVIEGPQTGSQFLLSPTALARVLLGKSPICDIRLTDPRVSRRHAALEPCDDGLRITDLGSTNGVTVNGVIVHDAILVGDEMIRLGGTTLRVVRGESTQSPEPPSADAFGRYLGASPELRRIYPLCQRLAESHVPVLLEGETGTGKERMAEALHEGGPRRHQPFVVFDCTATPENLVESILLGVERGAFTGAVRTTKGLVEEAHGGTLLIDEVGDLSSALQPKLLRMLDTSRIRRVGGSAPIEVNVRIIAATRRDLDAEVQNGRFRDDLYYRLAVARLELPPLRRRQGDVSFLAHRFWAELTGGERSLPRRLALVLQTYDWPGNVRELHNSVARNAALGDLAEQAARPSQRPSSPLASSAPLEESAPASSRDWLERVLSEETSFACARQKALEEFQRRFVERALQRHAGNVSRAAAASGVARRYFQLLKSRKRPDEEG